MSWFTDLLARWLSRDGAPRKRSFLQNQVGSLLNKYTGAGLTGAEQEANQFTAEQAEQANERNVFNYQHRYQWEVNDMEKAGLNPALLYGGSSGAGSVSSAPVGSSVSPTGNGMSDLVGSIMDLALMKAQIQNINADTKSKVADTAKSEAETERTKALTPHEIDNIVSQIDLRESDMSKNEAEIAVDYANVALLDSDAAYRGQFNQINLRLAELNAAKSEAERAKIEQETQNLIRDYTLSFVEESVMRANAGLLSQQTKNALAENDLIQFNTKTAKYEAKLTKYNYDHADGNRVWDRIATGAGIVRDAGIAAGAVVGGLSRVAASAAAETITNTTQEIFGSKGQRLRTIVTHQNRNK